MKKQEALDILELGSNASNSSVKSAYRRLASLHHPDKGGDSEKFKQCNEAYKLLIKITICEYCNGTGTQIIKKGLHQMKIKCAHC